MDVICYLRFLFCLFSAGPRNSIFSSPSREHCCQTTGSRHRRSWRFPFFVNRRDAQRRIISSEHLDPLHHGVGLSFEFAPEMLFTWFFFKGTVTFYIQTQSWSSFFFFLNEGIFVKYWCFSIFVHAHEYFQDCFTKDEMFLNEWLGITVIASCL